MTTDDDAEHLALATLAGDRRAFGRLAVLLVPFAEAAGNRATSSATDRQDEKHEIYAELLAKLERDDFAGLGKYVGWKDRHPEKTFQDWLRIVTANLARDRIRQRVGRRSKPGGPSDKRLLNELANLVPLDEVAYRPPVTTAQTARQIGEFAAAHLPPLQAKALAAWVQGDDFASVRESLGLETEEAAVRLSTACGPSRPRGEPEAGVGGRHREATSERMSNRSLARPRRQAQARAWT